MRDGVRLILGARDALKTQRFRSGFFYFFFFPSPAVSQAYDTGTGQAKIAVSVLYALDVGLNTHTRYTRSSFFFFLMAASFLKVKIEFGLIFEMGFV